MTWFHLHGCRFVALSAAGLLLVAAGCVDTDLASQRRSLQVVWDEGRGYPEELWLGSVSTGSYDEALVTVASTGGVAVQISRIQLETQATELFEDGEAIVLEPEQAQEVQVTFAPLQPGEADNVLLIASDADDGDIRVPIVTAATGDPLPDVWVTPTEHDFGEIQALASQTTLFTVGNAGFAPLEVEEVSISGSGAGAFSLVQDLVSGTVLEGAGYTATMTAEFTPTAVGPFQADLEIRSNDPDEPVLVVPLQGEGLADDGDGPVALCSVDPDPVAPLHGSATWIGHASYDAGGATLVSHSWTLTGRPAGSTAEMPDCEGTPDCGPFVADLAGTYTAQLVVVNDQEQQAECTAFLDAVPEQALWIELSWTLPADDMDLHLVAPGGSPWSNTDCYWATCRFSSPDWGETGNADDDPSLDLDDIPGTGPENINIPAPADGVYTVFVHDFLGSNAEEPDSDPGIANATTVRVYLDGLLVHTDTRSIDGDDSETYYCEIGWPDGIVSPL